MSHLDTITSAIDKHGPLTRGELLDITGIKDTVLDVTLTTGRKRGRLTRIVDSGRYDVTDKIDGDDDQVPEPVKPAPVVTTSTPSAPLNLQPARPVAQPVCVPDMQTPRAPAMQTQTPSTPVAMATVGNVVITITGTTAHLAQRALAAALQALL